MSLLPQMYSLIRELLVKVQHSSPLLLSVYAIQKINLTGYKSLLRILNNFNSYAELHSQVLLVASFVNELIIWMVGWLCVNGLPELTVD